MTEVKVGQIWKDNDKRVGERFIRILELDDKAVIVINIATGKKSKIAIKRLKPTAQGYTLTTDV